MGTDITILAEDPLRTSSGGSSWRLVGPPAFTSWTDVIRSSEVDPVAWEKHLQERFGEDVSPPCPSEVRMHRAYSWFGFLAGVRAPGEMPCISPPRGLPADLSYGARTWIWWWEWRWPRSGYAQSWLVASEIREYDYEQTLIPAGASRRCTLREYLGEDFFEWMRAWGVESHHERRLVLFFHD